MPQCPKSPSELDEFISRPTPAVTETVSRLPGRFAVLGAGGKMGFHVCSMLQRSLAAGNRAERVIAVSRFGDERTHAQFTEAGFDVISADLSDPAQVAALPDAAHVVFLAGVKFGTSHDPGLLQLMNVTVPQLVADRYRDSSIVALSTGCVYSFTTPDSGGSKEDSPTDPPGDYARSCLGREAAFVTAAERHGTRSAIIRLNYAIELRYGVMLDIARRVLRQEPVDVSMGCVNVIWQGDAIAHILQSFAHVAAPPAVLNITGADILRVRDLAEGFGRRLGCPVTLTGTESETAWLSNPAKSHVLFGRPGVAVETMMDWTANWLQQDGPTLDKPTHFEIRDGAY